MSETALDALLPVLVLSDVGEAAVAPEALRGGRHVVEVVHGDEEDVWRRG
jgi:hypothetical protein